MNIALVDVDGMNKRRGKRFPNLALMKLSAWHKSQGDSVEWYDPLFSKPDKIYASKIFTFSPDYTDYAYGDPKPEKGGTGYDVKKALDYEIEYIHPDYSLYPDCDYALGFSTRGCIRKCLWCVVPEKEGEIRIAGDIEQIAGARKEVILMDNNFLAADIEFVREQLQKAAALKIKIDFNQGLDARLMTTEIAELLVNCKWIRFIRFSCDGKQMIKPIREAVKMIRAAKSRREIFCYMLVTDDLADAEMRLRALVDLGITPFAQPYRDFSGNDKPSPKQRNFAKFANIKGGKLCRKIALKDYY